MSKKNVKKAPAKQQDTSKVFTKEQEESIIACFQSVDVKKKGYLEQSQLLEVLFRLGFNPTDDELVRMMKTTSLDKEGRISAEAYMKMVKDNYDDLRQENERMRDAFKILDKDSDGFITLAEFKTIICHKNDYFSEKDVVGFFDEIDTDGNGVIDYNEFVESEFCSTLFT